MNTESKFPKKVFFVNWKRHKVDQVLLHTKEITENYFEDIIFNTIIDFYRQNYGFPNALSLEKLIENEPVIPPSPFNVHTLPNEQQEGSRNQKCPICNDSRDHRLFTNHLESCIKKCKPVDVACAISNNNEI